MGTQEKALSRVHVSMGLAFPGTRKEVAPLEARNKRKQPLEWPPEGGMSLAPRCSFSMYDTVPSDLLLFFSVPICALLGSLLYGTLDPDARPATA